MTTTPRNHETLRAFRRDLGHTDDTELCGLLDRLLAGDESVREDVESACDVVDRDVRRMESPHA